MDIKMSNNGTKAQNFQLKRLVPITHSSLFWTTFFTTTFI